MVVSETVLGVLQTTLCANAVEVPIRHSKQNSIAFFFIIRCICFRAQRYYYFLKIRPFLQKIVVTPFYYIF